MEFQSWKVKFKNEVCSTTADFHLTMQWIREVEMSKSIDELVTSRLVVGRRDFTDFNVFDAMIAYALRRLLDKHLHFLKRVSVEEQRAQNSDRFFRGRPIISVQPGPVERHKESQICSLSLQTDHVQDFDVEWDQALLSASEIPSDVILEGLYKSKLQDSVQLQTVLALYDRETAQNNGQTIYVRLKTAVKLHFDQMMRSRNFTDRNEVVERGSVTESQKGKKPAVRGKWENAFSGKHVRYTSFTTTVSHDNNNHRTSKHASTSWRSDGSRVGPGQNPLYTRAHFGGEAVGCSLALQHTTKNTHTFKMN